MNYQGRHIKNLRGEVPSTPVTPAKAGVQRKICVAKQHFIYLCKEDCKEPLRGAFFTGSLPAQV